MKTKFLSLLIFISGIVTAQKTVSLSRFPDDKIMVWPTEPTGGRPLKILPGR